MILNGLPWRRTELILSFLRLHPSTAYNTKSNCVHAHWGQIPEQKIQRDQKTQLPLLKSWQQTNKQKGKLTESGQCWQKWDRACGPALSTTKGCASHLHHSSAHPWTHPEPPPRQEAAHPHSGAAKHLLLVLATHTPSATGAPIKPCLNVLSGLWSISIDWGRPRTLVRMGPPTLGERKEGCPQWRDQQWLLRGFGNLRFPHCEEMVAYKTE